MQNSIDPGKVSRGGHNQVLGKLAHHLELKRSLANKATTGKGKENTVSLRQGKNQMWQIYQDKQAY